MKNKICAVLIFIIAATCMLTFLNPGKKIQSLKKMKNLEVVDKAPQIKVLKRKLVLVEGQSYNLLDNATVVDDYDNIKLSSNILNTEKLNVGLYEITYKAIDRKNNLTEEIINLEILNKYDDYDQDGYSNIEELDFKTDYLNNQNFPNYEKLPQINLMHFNETLNIGEEFYYSVVGFDNYDGYLNVEVYTNLDRNIEGNYYMVFRCYDKVGNQTQIIKNIKVVDNKEFVFTNFYSDYNGEWTNDSVSINYSFNKDLSYVEYSYDKLTWKKNTKNNITINETINGTLYVRGISKKGEISNINQIDLKIDKEEIIIEAENKILEANKDFYYECEIPKIETVSGIKDITIENNVNMGKVGKYSCIYNVTNNAGTSIKKEIIIEIEDTIAPTIKNTYFYLINGENFEEKLEIIENSNDLVSLEYTLPTQEGEHTVTIKLKDSSNNESIIDIKINILKNIKVINYKGEEIVVENNKDLLKDEFINNIYLKNIKIDSESNKRIYEVKILDTEESIVLTQEMINIIINNIDTEIGDFIYTSSEGFRLK